jgi:hypothetical protein
VKIFDTSKFRVRKLTPKEYGRLQAFPVDDGWEQVVSDSQAYKQFGNAVTTTVVTAIAECIKATLDAGATESMENQPLPLEKETTGIEVLKEFSTEQLLQELMRRNAMSG